MTAKDIPWQLADTDEYSLWQWNTEHFRANIQTDSYEKSYSWQIYDISSGDIMLLSDGVNPSFEKAENEIREIIGKSYAPNLGYRDYSGALATTFTVFNKDRLDFGPIQSQKVIMMVRGNDDNGQVKERRLIGKLSIDHYHIIISPEHDNPIKVPPTRILKVQPEFGLELKPVEEEDTLAKDLRTYPGIAEKGCTGIPSSIYGYVEHPGDTRQTPRCPIHEIGM